MKLKQFFLCLLIILISGLLYHFRSVPTGQLWDNYTVFYVPVNSDDNVITETFAENGIKDYTSINNQDNPVQLEKGSMAELMFKMNLSNNDNQYLERRNNYFFDSEKEYSIYYIPNRYKDKIEKTVKYLDKCGIAAGVDSSVAFPWVLPVIITLAALIVLFCVKNKLLFFFSMAVPVLYVYCNPFYSATAACVIEMLVMVYISNLWNKDGAANKIVKNPVLWIVVLSSLVSAFAVSVSTGIFFIASLIAQAAVILICKLHIINKVSKQTYVFVDIKPLKMIPVYAKKEKILFPVMILAGISVFGAYKFYAGNNIQSHFSKILLPGIAEEHNDYFPKLDEYYQWNWKIISYPNKSLNLSYDENPYEISFPRYVKEGSEIKQVTEVFAYDSSFKKTMYDNIDDLGKNNIEHVIKSQGSNFNCDFTTAKNYQVSFFSVIMVIICIFILIIIYFSVMIKKDGRK